jgi:hypothetical protein
MTDHPPFPQVTAGPERIADYVSSVVGITLSQDSVEGVAANLRLLLSHWAIFGAPDEEAQ